MVDFTVGGNNYRSDKMDAFTQFHVVRRLAPIFSSLKDAFSGAAESMDILDSIASAISGMSDSDSEYVLKACLDVVKRQQGQAWAVLRAGGRMMFTDIDLPIMLQITTHILQENIAPFFSGPPASNLEIAEKA